MESKFQSITLGDLVALQRGHDLTEKERISGNVPVIGSAGQNGFHDTALAQGPGIVIGRSGASFGEVHFCEFAFWPHNTGLYVTDFKGNNPYFCFYLFKILDFKRYNSGSAQPSLNRNFIYQIPIKIPEISQQKRIGEILWTLDRKIELNRRMNATLEAMARALFQNWFVDFDPVRAKLDGRKPAGMDDETAALFPSEFEDSSIGPIPKGWNLESVYNAADVIYGAPFASSLFNTNGDGKPLLRIRDLANENPSIFTPEIHPKGYSVRPGDIVVGMDGEFRAYLWGGLEVWLNQRLCVFLPKPGFSGSFVRNSIIPLLAQVEATETATTVIHLGKNDIDRFLIVIPTPQVVGKFSQFCQPIYDKIVSLKQQSRTLTTLRDSLLPKLLSGEISVTSEEVKRAVNA